MLTMLLQPPEDSRYATACRLSQYAPATPLEIIDDAIERSSYGDTPRRRRFFLYADAAVML